jgi:regulator of replication initiation timing
MYNSLSNLHHLEELVSDLANQINLLTTENQAIKERLAYLEWDLHRENGCLQAENLSLRHMVDYSSEEYNSLEDSLR